MTNTVVGVILPCYNEEDWVAGAIESVLAQTYEEFELLIVDDGSTDRTIDVVEEFSDSRIDYVQQVNGGHASALNTGLNSLDTDYYAFIDADDRWHADKLEKQIALLKSTAATLVHTNAEYVDVDDTPIGKHHDEHPPTSTNREEMLRDLFLNNFVLTPTVACHRSAIDEKRFNEELYANADHDMWLRVAEDNEIGYVDEILIQYRVHDGNISKNYEKLFEDRKTVARRFSERNQLPEALANRVLSDVYLTYGINLALDGRNKEARPILRQAAAHDWTNWKIYGTYPLTYFGHGLLKSLSKAGQNY